MEFEQLQKIWIEKRNESFFVTSQDAIHAAIRRRQKSSQRIAGLSELVTIVVNLLSGGFILAWNIGGKQNNWLYFISAWMLGTAAYGIYHRSRRKELAPQNSATMRDHLTQALHSATHQVKLSRLMRLNIIPVAILTSLALWGSGNSTGLVIGAPVFFLACFYFSGWEHRSYVRRKKQLEVLQDALNA
ncbi:MAG: hypothetical protein EOO05_12310 [Chitinophagaceae bacterium]|nr:MAG: hypothetical protein EOO05_12310 [Chitinophagaceae bacterium]